MCVCMCVRLCVCAETSCEADARKRLIVTQRHVTNRHIHFNTKTVRRTWYWQTDNSFTGNDITMLLLEIVTMYVCNLCHNHNLFTVPLTMSRSGNECQCHTCINVTNVSTLRNTNAIFASVNKDASWNISEALHADLFIQATWAFLWHFQWNLTICLSRADTECLSLIFVYSNLAQRHKIRKSTPKPKRNNLSRIRSSLEGDLVMEKAEIVVLDNTLNFVI